MTWPNYRQVLEKVFFDRWRKEPASIRVTEIKKVKHNSIQSIKTTIGPTKKKIDLPEDCQCLKLTYTSASKLWVGNEASVAVDGSDSFPVLTNEYFLLDLKKGNGNDFWGVSSSGNIDVYVTGGFKS